jgi:hypothetical protein
VNNYFFGVKTAGLSFGFGDAHTSPISQQLNEFDMFSLRITLLQFRYAGCVQPFLLQVQLMALPGQRESANQ